MSLVFQTVVLSFITLVACLLPRLSSTVRKYSTIVLLVGTGTLFGFCFFSLVPEAWQVGGHLSLVIIAAVGILYSFFHLFHIHHDHEDGDAHSHGFFPVYVFIGGMSLHCFADGLVLGTAAGLAKSVSSAIFLALIAHKTYEALTLSSLLQEKLTDLREFLMAAFFYVSALPLGALVSSWGNRFISTYAGPSAFQTAAVWITSIAVGSLIGCLVQDFMLPSYAKIREERRQAGWLIAGVVCAVFIVRFF